MRILSDKALLEQYFQAHKASFRQPPPVLQLVEFQKGELLTTPLQSLRRFYILVKGNVSIYDLTEDGSVRYIAKGEVGALLGDVEFCGANTQSSYTEAMESVLCLGIPFQENRSALENDPVFLRFLARQLVQKLAFSAAMGAPAQTLEEKVLFFLRRVQPGHEISSVNHALQPLHCSRRQLQRVLKKLCEEGTLLKIGRGRYRLQEPQ